ncbi:MAG TPA: 2-C-methyl-D-erythritol 4-phosphate cytidylyltransferase [Candidatus Sumerlaeota bacterium]|nr:2-C-methyl-D-erythritol 4-phosphate cytidylyltransferase [Candidatus Sumerlaeota bacterium]
MRTWAVILGGGRGLRAGGQEPKQLRLLAGRPLIHYSLEAFQNCPDVEGIILVIHPDYAEHPAVKDCGLLFPSLRGLAHGGALRQNSVLNGLLAVPEDVELVAIHDGARPFPPPGGIRQAIAAAKDKGGAILAIPVTDTVKSCTADGRILDTPDRSCLRLAQTPQVFRRAWIIEGYRAAADDGVTLTDDAAALQCTGRDVFVVEGCRDNIKVTYDEDFTLAEHILARREERKPS